MVLIKPALTVVDQKVQGEVVVLSVQRDLLEEGTCPLKEAIDRLVAEGRPSIVIDLQEIPLMDSGDIGRLIRAHISLRRNGRRVHLCGVQPRVARILEMTRLDTVFAIHESCSSAIRAVKKEGRPGGRAE